MRQRSKKMAELYRHQRVPLVRDMLADWPWCELAEPIWRVDPSWRSCARYAIGLHELRKRSQGGSITDPANLLRCCGPCNSWVEDHPLLARQAGLVLRAGDTTPGS